MSDVKLPCAVGSQWQRPVARRGVSFGSCGSVVDQDLAGGVAYHRWFGVSQQLRTLGGFERAEIPDNRDVAATSMANRGQYVRRGQRLEYFTIAYNSLEGAASILPGCSPVPSRS